MAGPGAAGLWPAMAKMRPVGGGGAVANSYHFAIFSFFSFFCIYNMSICYFYDLFSFFHF
jgi:hypothetical protein